MRPIDELTTEYAQKIRFVLMDIDDTLTTDGKLLAESYAAMWRLKQAGLIVVPITGRPAGWCDLIAREWPVDGVVGENGAFAFWEGEGQQLKTLTHPQAIRNTSPLLQEIRDVALQQFPELRIARDQFSRLYDIALDFAEEEPRLPLATAVEVKKLCEQKGAHAKVSSIHVNTWLGNYDKLSMAIRFLAERFGYDDEAMRGQVIFVGDSPNDEPMFAHFPNACGVANVIRYENLIKRLPAFVADREGGLGFAQIAKILITRRAG